MKSVKCGVWSVECEVSVWSAKSAVWSVKCEVWSVKEAVRSVKCEVLSVECEVWSVKFQFGVRRAQCEVWSVECEVWSLECEECSVKCGVWSVKTLLRLSLKKSNGCRGKDTVGTGCLWTIGHLCLGNFRRRLARVYVSFTSCPRYPMSRATGGTWWIQRLSRSGHLSCALCKTQRIRRLSGMMWHHACLRMVRFLDQVSKCNGKDLGDCF